MPYHLNGHSSAVITGNRHGTEVMFTLGKSGKIDNYKTLMFNLETMQWRDGASFPSDSNGAKIKYDHVMF